MLCQTLRRKRRRRRSQSLPTSRRTRRTPRVWPNATRAGRRFAPSPERLRIPLSADRRGVLNAAVVPQFVESAGNPELRIDADVTVERFAVVADRPNYADGPVIGKAERLAEVPLRPDEPFGRGLLRLQRIINGFRSDAELFGVEHGEIDPLDD